MGDHYMRRRRFLLSRGQIAKIEELAQREGISRNEIVRRMIDTYLCCEHGTEAVVDAALHSMTTAVRRARLEVADVRSRFEKASSDEAIAARRAQTASEVRAYFATHPDEWDRAVSELPARRSRR